MKLADFEHVVDFPEKKNVVYVLFCTLESDGDSKPFYVGETASFTGRMTDYFRATFAATTDFKVGEAIRYLVENRVRVRVGFNECSDRKTAEQQERDLIKLYKSQGIPLLNELNGYNYHTATREDERTKVREFCKNSILGRSSASKTAITD